MLIRNVVTPSHIEFLLRQVADDPVNEQFSWFGVMLLIDRLRDYTGPQQVPVEISVFAIWNACIILPDYIRDRGLRAAAASVCDYKLM